MAKKSIYGYQKFFLKPQAEKPGETAETKLPDFPDPYPGNHHQKLFEHMYETHGLILLISEMDEIVRIVEEEY